MATLAVFGGGVGACGLFAHVINLQGQDGEAVDGPCRALGVEPCVGQRVHLGVFLAEVGVYLLHEISAVLVGAVDATLQRQGVERVDVRVADDVFQVPLYGVYPAFQVETVVYRVTLKRVVDGRVDVVGDVIIVDGLVENFVAVLCK